LIAGRCPAAPQPVAAGHGVRHTSSSFPRKVAGACARQQRYGNVTRSVCRGAGFASLRLQAARSPRVTLGWGKRRGGKWHRRGCVPGPSPGVACHDARNVCIPVHLPALQLVFESLARRPM